MNGHQLADTKSASTKMEGNCLSTDGVDANQGLEYVVPFAHSCEDCILVAALASSWRLSLHLRLPLALRAP